MGSDPPAAVPAPRLTLESGHAFVAEVLIHAVTKAAPDRHRVVFYDGDARSVRDKSGRLLWLESPEIYAFRKQAADELIMKAGPDVDVVIPRDAVVEALAVVDPSSLCEWTGGRLIALPDGGQFRLDVSDWGPLVVTMSAVGSIRSVAKLTRPSRAILTSVREEVGLRKAEWFRAIDIDIASDNWPW
jgi:hypothetical protein